jgi:tripartite-type tricarboxylate transporter receptor subunit TctC
MINRLNAEMQKAVNVPEVKARLAAMGGEVAAGTTDAMRERVARELATWTKTVDDAGIAKQ